MKQKIVIQVHVRCDKCRTKALKIAAVADGVISVALEGPDKDKVVVVGDGVDVADLTIRLNKKIGYASLLTVEEVKPKTDDKKKEEDKDKDKDKDNKPTPCGSSCNCQHSQCQLYGVVYDPYPTSNCSIM